MHALPCWQPVSDHCHAVSAFAGATCECSPGASSMEALTFVDTEAESGRSWGMRAGCRSYALAGFTRIVRGSGYVPLVPPTNIRMHLDNEAASHGELSGCCCKLVRACHAIRKQFLYAAGLANYLNLPYLCSPRGYTTRGLTGQSSCQPMRPASRRLILH